MKTGDGTARVEFDVRFSRGRTGSRKMKTVPKPTEKQNLQSVPEQVPKLTRRLVLGHYFEGLVRDGVVKNYAEIARLIGISRARVTQFVNLTLLTPRVQDEILSPGDRSGDPHLLERRLRRLLDTLSWPDQE